MELIGASHNKVRKNETKEGCRDEEIKLERKNVGIKGEAQGGQSSGKMELLGVSGWMKG